MHGHHDRHAPPEQAEDDGIGEGEGQPLEVQEPADATEREAVPEVLGRLQRRAQGSEPARRRVGAAVEERAKGDAGVGLAGAQRPADELGVDAGAPQRGHQGRVVGDGEERGVDDPHGAEAAAVARHRVQ